MDHIDTLLAPIRGRVVGSEDVDYNALREVFNAMHDRRPARIVRPADPEDVATTIRAAKGSGLTLAVRAGGHSAPGFSTCDDGIVLDLRSLDAVSVDPIRATARVGGGCTWGQLNDATYHHGLATPGGVVSTTGVGGLTTGGGIGYLSRAHGLSCDNVLAAEVATADGSLVRCDRDTNADLYWAVRGGSGNFGVVTSFEFALHPVRDIIGGPTFFAPEPDVVEAYREYMKTAPRDLGALFGLTRAPAVPFVPVEWHGRPVAAMLTCWSGDPDQAEEVLKPLEGWGQVVGRFVGPMPYPAINTLFDDLLHFGLRHYWKSLVASDVSDSAIAVHQEFIPSVPNVESGVFFHPINGACHDVAEDESAFPHRDALFLVGIYGSWHRPQEDEDVVEWVRSCHRALQPYYLDSDYVNFAPAQPEATKSIFRHNYERLTHVKHRYDPDNLFRHNQNIPPVPGP